MMIAPVVDLLDNIWAIRKCLKEKNTKAREEKIMTIVARELVEIVASFTVLVLFPIIWTTNRHSFFLIDEITPAKFQRGMIGMGVDFVAQLAVLFLFSKLMAARFQVKLPNLILAITETIGVVSMFCIVRVRARSGSLKILPPKPLDAGGCRRHVYHGFHDVRARAKRAQRRASGSSTPTTDASNCSSR
jgi:hypothetical protein